jgi:GNAT superfamily N-acetyltransferase
VVLSGIWKKQHHNDDYLPQIVISHEKTISAFDVQDLCTSVGWLRRDPTLIMKALENSLSVISAWDKNILVGFARATGDKVFNATIWDMAVRPSHQGRGIGKLVMVELLAELDRFNIPLITLYADPGTDMFYKHFGFLSDPLGVRGMFRETA